jgi:hypothetical protein
MNRVVKYTCLALLMALVATGCRNRQEKLNGEMVSNPMSADGMQNNPAPVIKFEVAEHDFGKIVAGEKVTYNFKFKNTGTADLLITKVSASCGCTAPSYPSTPIAPGEEGVVSVAFNSEIRNGFQNKTVTVLTNTIPNTTQLRIKAQVMSPSEM